MKKWTPYMRGCCLVLLPAFLCIADFSATRLSEIVPVLIPQIKALGLTDAAHYRSAFELERAHQPARADAELAQVGDPLLKATFLAERYRSLDYKASYEELGAWLKEYGDHPQAPDLYRLALARKPAAAANPTEPQVSKPFAGEHISHHRSGLNDYGRHWEDGIAAYRAGRMKEAAQDFDAVLHEPHSYSAEDRTAAAFWAYRALSAAGEKEAALHYAQSAASGPPGFYSFLAREVTAGKEIFTDAAWLRRQKAAPLLESSNVRRAIALKESGQDTFAAEELAMLFAASDDDTRTRLFTLASLLDLQAAQMRMVLVVASENGDPGNAFFPVPEWSPSAGYHLDPALLFAIMRQESGFDPRARNPRSGALGVMQIMPATARTLSHSLSLNSSLTPAMGMTLGQSYLENLMDTPAIGDNLVLLTAAYNAGPGKAASWRHDLHYANDPLLFIESIPYAETRDYIVRVIGNYWVYSQLLGSGGANSLAELAGGQWPHYGSGGKQLVSMVSQLGN